MRIFAALIICCLLSLPAAAKIEVVTLPAAGESQLTIYNSEDLTLVRDRRTLTFKKGLNRIEFSWANTLIDPTSVTFEARDKKSGLQILDTSFPPRIANTLTWTIQAPTAGHVPVEITYFTSGIRWNADYVLVMDPTEEEARLEGYVTVKNISGEEYADSQIRLVVGTVHMVESVASLGRGVQLQNALEIYEKDIPYPEEEADDLEGIFSDSDDAPVPTCKPKAIVKEGLSEYFIFTVEGRETIANQWSKRLPSLTVKTLPVDALFKHEDFRLGPAAVRFVTFRNDEEHGLGKEPLPDGSLRVLKTDAAGNLQYLGASSLKYIPLNETVEVNLGPDPEVKVEIELLDYRLQNHQFDQQGNVSGWDTLQTYHVKVRNFKNTPLKMRILRRHQGKFTIETTEPNTMDDERTVRFDPRIQAGTDREFNYTVRTFQGRNADGK